MRRTTHSVARTALLAALLALSAACGTDDRPPSWGYIHEAIIRPSCARVSCHSGDNAQSGIALHTAQAAYRALVADECDDADPPAGQLGGYVVPAEPDQSALLNLLDGGPVELAMPPDRLLPRADVALIEEWIARGAPCD